MIIVSGTASKEISAELSQLTGIKLAKTEIKRFPDGECYVRILSNGESIRGKHAIVVQTTYPDPNLIELFLLQGALREAGVSRITTIIPYYGYARQDTIFKEGEVVSAKALATLIQVNSDDVVIIDPHKEYICDFFDVPARAATAVPQIAARLIEHGVDMVLAPDKGAMARAEMAARIIGCPYDYLEKTRIDGETVVMKAKELDVRGKRVAIVDDIISTGGTMAKAISHLKSQGATKVYACCTHGLFTGSAIDKLKNGGADEIVCTDTIESENSNISAAGAIADALGI
ncbi:MAG: ribose-phosphate diphosphokinase [Thermoplasmata archaeon HGW-Thermoplasmata-1]|nr:MAG: ribose-phosphate diphosphokinase [Thermoplasmata archaeon HGW-Thermoplasmata-1]